jgi:endoglucanase
MGCEAGVPSLPEYLVAKIPADLPVPTKGVAGIADLKRGINLGNALDAPKEGEWGVTLSEAHFRMAAAAGFDHIRLPVRFSAYSGVTEPYTIDEKIFKRVDFALDQAEALGLAVILDLHHFEEIMKTPAAHLPRLIAMWKQIATRYLARGPKLKYELLNEPNGPIDSQWNTLYPDVLAVVRAIDLTRTILIDGESWAAASSLSKLTLVDDPNLVATFHMYEPILFTHQGASWMSAEYQTKGIVFPGPLCAPVTPVAAAQNIQWVAGWFQSYNLDPPETNRGGPALVQNLFSVVDNFVRTTGTAVYLGEFAVLNTADTGSRVRWLRLIRDHAEARKIPWAYWDDGGSNKAMDTSTGKWSEPLRRALLD